MRHRTHDQLFAAAGVTAALSLIGTGVTVLKGSVFHFDRWPNVAGDLARAVQLPLAPLTQAEHHRDAERRSLFATVLRADGTTVVPGLGTGDGISSVGISLGGGGTVPATGPGSPGTTVPGSTEATRGGARSGVSLDGSAGALGAPSSLVDGTRDPSTAPGTTGSSPRVASSAEDTDHDGVPDSWDSDHGTG
ncbi:MAG TPA: hypothetical protein VGM33_00600, partial [Baekduia sp.]